ncbi:MAG: DUF262 domain-containing protein [Methylacidiphilales bacterium]|nr:DUF262 domain-containing protein [Candidatus Methylacidiphilales bacterium]
MVLQTIENKKYIVIDGQQRLTTLSLIILVALKCLETLEVNQQEKSSVA